MSCDLQVEDDSWGTHKFMQLCSMLVLSPIWPVTWVEVVMTIVRLACDEASFITGANLTVRGGSNMQQQVMLVSEGERNA